MFDQRQTYEDVLAEAQARGYAEADPAMDVDGTDAAQKLSILTNWPLELESHWSRLFVRVFSTLNFSICWLLPSWVTE